jgi:CubicO group peptidase (beta-lactamase class C family)
MPLHPNRALRFISCCRPQVERSCSDVVGTCRSLESPECEPRPTLGVVDLRACYQGVELGLRLFIGTLSMTLFLAALPSAAWSQAPVQAAPKSLSVSISEVVASVSFAEIVNGKLTIAEAFGEQSPGVPATTSTLYNIASMTKPISAEVILRLASQGKLSLDEPMYLYWTDPDIANDERRKLLTPRLVLSHQTGFPNWRRETGGRLAFIRTPGTAYGYSGEGFEYVAHFTEKRTGEAFETLAQQLIFRPAGMTSTAYTRRDWFKGRIAVPTDGEGKWLVPSVADKFSAADMVYTTPSDYSRFLIGVMNGQGLSSAVRADRSRMQVDHDFKSCTAAWAAGCPDEVGFGLGWEIIKVKGKTFWMHTGRDPGLFTVGFIDPVERTGTIIFTNSERGAEVVVPLLHLLEADPVFIAYLEGQR